MKPEPVTTPEDGFELCYECDGLRTCLTCLGNGKYRDGTRCGTCGGSGWCYVCQGSGELRLGTLARLDAGNYGDPDDDDPPPTGSDKRVAKMVGHLRELGDEDAPSVQTARRRAREQDLTAVVAYLRAGKLLVMSPGLIKDPFAAGALAGKRSIRTDGTYAWSDALAYFVERYQLELPDQFEQHMRAQRWTMPATIDVSGLVPGQ